jgi:TadE-like protein
MIITVIMLMLLGMVEFGFIFDHHLTLEYATREGARVGAALANGGGAMGCATGQSPNAGTVDQQVIAAVQRVVTSPGSAVVPSRIAEIRIYKSNASGQEVTGFVNRYTYNPGAGPSVDGKNLDFAQSGGTGWSVCSRNNGSGADSLGVSLVYNYQLVTPLSAVMNFFGGGMSGVTISDRTIMALNPGS